MLFKQDDLCVDDVTAVFESCDYLTEEESQYFPSMVSIRENTRLGLNIIKVEDLVEYAMYNGITEASEAISNICEANGVDISTIGFSVDDVSVLEDTEMADTALQLKESGVQVFTSPISTNDIIYKVTEAVVDVMTEAHGTEDEKIADSLFESFIMDDMDQVLSENAVIDKIKSGASTVKDAAVKAKDKVVDTAGEVKDKVTSMAGNAKKAAAKKLASLKVTYNNLKKKLSSAATGEGKKKIQVVMAKVKQGIEFLKQKLIGAKDTIASKF